MCAGIMSILCPLNPLQSVGQLMLRAVRAQAKRRATANSAKEKQAALVAGGHASEDEEAPLVRQQDSNPEIPPSA